ncbi:MAG: hypothetical protein H7066_20410 [Cytophagaceae bacterium]|nr:hypothetical protein [Gemmatimonadaceae bacterium]
MRIVRKLGYTLLVAIVPTVASAQAAQPRNSFDDSWYWGAKGGVASFDPNGSGRVTAPSMGAEWLITRSRAALYISIDQAMFDETAGVYDPSVQGSVRPVSISDLRRYGAGLYAFPVAINNIRPYLGFGLSINVIQDADPKGTFVSSNSQDSVFNAVQEQTSKVSAVFTGGAQVNFGRIALFGQASAMPTRNNFLFAGASHTFVLEAGLRYNLARAIEQLK